MNELALSNDINVITAEINSYKQIAGQAIFEIGRRLKKVRDAKLDSEDEEERSFANQREKLGGWIKWLSDNVDFKRGHADKFIKVYERFDAKDVLSTRHSLDALYHISTIPESEREEEHEIPSTGEKKTVDEMTVKELIEVKAELKKAKTELSDSTKEKERIEAEKNRLRQLYNEEKSRKPRVVEVERVKEVRVEVMPEDKKKQLSEYEQDIKTYKDTLEALNNEKQMLEEKVAQWEEVDTLDVKKQKLELEKHISIYEMQIKIKKFLEDAAPSLFLQGAIASSDPIIKKALYENAKALEGFTETLKEIIKSEIELENAEFTEIT